jgi:oxygen-independent coproporphyrinogen-3 oxidase
MTKLALYIHIPFCLKKCAYCDFNSVPLKSQDTSRRYIQRLLGEIRQHGETHAQGRIVDTIYFGGGTPSLLAPRDIRDTLTAVQQCFTVGARPEITIEGNPGTVTRDKLRGYTDCGVTRLSLGSQSFIDSELKLLGRVHTAKDICTAYEAAREAGFRNISLDLIFGLPAQHSEDLSYSLGEILRLAPEHVSTYSLTIEKGTLLARMVAAKKLPYPDQDTQAHMFRTIEKTLSGNGYTQYEISNFAKKGYESRHNQAYWTGKDYIGFGAGAHSYLDGVRYANTKDAVCYIERNRVKRFGKLSDDERFRERIVLGLRMLKGIAIGKHAASRSNLQTRIQPLIDDGLLEYRKGILKLTDTGVFFYDTVAVELL